MCVLLALCSILVSYTIVAGSNNLFKMIIFFVTELQKFRENSLVFSPAVIYVKM